MIPVLAQHWCVIPRDPHIGGGQRPARVGEAIRHVLAELLPNTHFRDPVLHDLSVTVTEAKVSPDLRNATVFVTPLGGKNPDEIVAALNRSAPYLRGEVTRALRLRFAPHLRFSADRTFDSSSRVAELLRDPRVARDLKRDGDG